MNNPLFESKEPLTVDGEEFIIERKLVYEPNNEDLDSNVITLSCITTINKVVPDEPK